MARFSFNSDSLNDDTGLIIEDIRFDPALAGQLGAGATPSFALSEGDINGDGSNDIFVQSGFFFQGTNFTQENFVILGGDSLPATIEIDQIDGSNGFTLNELVGSIAGFDDLNGDGRDDLIVTTIDPLGGNGGVSVILGNGEFPSNVDVTSLDGSNGFDIVDGNNTVFPISFQADVNNDGVNDFALVSSSTTSTGETTATNKVVFGRESYTEELDISALDGSNGFAVFGEATFASTAFDFNGDEFDDILFGDNESTSYLVYGQAQYDASLDLNALAPEDGFSITAEEAVEGEIVSGGLIGDLNGDGLAEIVLQKITQTTDAEGNVVNESEENYVIYGSSNNINTLDINDLDGSNGFTITEPSELQSIVDLNGDGRQDLLFKTVADEQSYVVFGSDALPAAIDREFLNGLDGSNGFKIENANIEAQTIANFGAIGDINADGIDDVAIDSADDDLYILLGSNSFPAAIDLTDSEANALLITGNNSANGISSFSDVNGDGADDLIFNSIINEADDPGFSQVAILYGDSELGFASDNAPDSGGGDGDGNAGGGDGDGDGDGNGGNGNDGGDSSGGSGSGGDGDGDGNGGGDDSTIDLFRFRNTAFDSGTYLFVGAEERDSIQENPDFSETFTLEGDGNAAFTASLEDGEDLIPFYRLASLDIPGTYLFVSTGEYDAIFAEDSDQRDKWVQEGLDAEDNDIPEFYLLDGSADRGTEFNRFQNTQNGTFLYAGPEETAAIESDPNLSSLFTNQGVAFESL